MKLGSIAQNATSYILINFEPYEVISAEDIEPSPYEFQKFPKTSFFFRKKCIFYSIIE